MRLLMCVCVCVCVCVWYVLAYVVFGCVCLQSICVFAFWFVLCTYVYTYMNICVSRKFVYVYACMYVCMCVCVCVCVCVHTCVHM